MRIHVVQHVPFEGPGRIADWAAARGHVITESLAPTESFPEPDSLSLVCVMGGPMDADDHERSPWLVAEKAWLGAVAEAGVPILGICLGAQILAEVLGGRVLRNAQREIGWFPVELTKAGRTSRIFAEWPPSLVVGHWHADTFELPGGVLPALSSEACANQAFELDGRFVGLQCHLEWEYAGIEALVAACADELVDGGLFVQPAEAVLALAPTYLPGCEQPLFAVLDRLAEASTQ